MCCCKNGGAQNLRRKLCNNKLTIIIIIITSGQINLTKGAAKHALLALGNSSPIALYIPYGMATVQQNCERL